MNATLWNDNIKPRTKQQHLQFGIEAISRAAKVVVNKETWRAFLEVLGTLLKRIVWPHTLLPKNVSQL